MKGQKSKIQIILILINLIVNFYTWNITSRLIFYFYPASYYINLINKLFSHFCLWCMHMWILNYYIIALPKRLYLLSSISFSFSFSNFLRNYELVWHEGNITLNYSYDHTSYITSITSICNYHIQNDA
jgi:hypothetical protein